jgi:hypothetical protein
MSAAKRTVFMCTMGCQILYQPLTATRVMCWVCSAVWTPSIQLLWKPSLVILKPMWIKLIHLLLSDILILNAVHQEKNEF